MLFVHIIRQLAPVLSSLGLQPLLCAGGASGGTEFAREVRSALLEAAPSAIIVEGFMGPEKMAEIFLHVSDTCSSGSMHAPGNVLLWECSFCSFRKVHAPELHIVYVSPAHVHASYDQLHISCIH